MIETNYKDIFKIDKKKLDKIDPEIYQLLKFWKSNKNEILVNTSGSTGKPKTIKISRQQLINSSKATLKHFKLKENTTFLSCLPVKYIGGKMMIIRGIIGKVNFILCKPSVSPIKKLHKEIDFMATTPLQLDSLLKNITIFSKIRLAIVGGGKVSERLIEQLQDIPYDCFETYGMTETVSHIAVRNLKKNNENNPFKCLENNSVTTNSNDQLVINSKYLKISSLTTNDIAKVTGNKYFTINGRVDNIINSGGFKVSSENIEELLYENFQNKLFFIDKIKCDKLGEKIILIADEKIKLQELVISIRKIKDKKKRPKEIYFTNRFFYNGNQKIDRPKTKTKALSLNIIHKLN
jgi:O-succinylbenzoic acid--CoA ligase